RGNNSVDDEPTRYGKAKPHLFDHGGDHVVAWFHGDVYGIASRVEHRLGRQTRAGRRHLGIYQTSPAFICDGADDWISPSRFPCPYCGNISGGRDGWKMDAEYGSDVTES